MQKDTWFSFFRGYSLPCCVVKVFILLTLYTFNIIYDAQPKPFIDELFHVPQAEIYCEARFREYHPKITTLPGLYILSVSALLPLKWLTDIDLCNVYGLRFGNVIVCFINYWLMYQVRKHVRKDIYQEGDSPNTFWEDFMSATNIALLPVLYLFSFFYYTDPLAVCVILATYLCSLKEKHVLATAAAAFAVLVRQTNIVWIAFLTLLGLDRICRMLVRKYFPTVRFSNLRTSQYLKLLEKSLFQAWEHGTTSRVNLAENIIQTTGGFIFIGVLFVLFVIWNGSIVVGDHSAHQAVLNIPQLFYYFLFVAVFASPHAVQFIKSYICCMYRNKLLTLGVMLMCAVFIHFYTYVHPYLLADNRHYSAIVWRKLYQRHDMVRYLLIPVYLFGGYVLSEMLNGADYVVRVAYYAMLLVCLIPQRLFEFRYFIIPYIFLRLHYFPRNKGPVLAETVLFVIINVLTVYVFLTKTFYWEDSPDVQRIIW